MTVNYESLKYNTAEDRSKEMLEKIRQKLIEQNSSLAQKQPQKQTLKKFGSTSTLNSVNSMDSISSHDKGINLNNTTFDLPLRLLPQAAVHQTVVTATQPKVTNMKSRLMASNTTFTVKKGIVAVTNSTQTQTLLKTVNKDINEHKSRLQKAQMLRDDYHLSLKTPSKAYYPASNLKGKHKTLI